jgi:hypothetical protein
MATAAEISQKTTLLQRRIAVADNWIDQLVHQFYDLTHNEIALVEKAGEAS